MIYWRLEIAKKLNESVKSVSCHSSLILMNIPSPPNLQISEHLIKTCKLFLVHHIYFYLPERFFNFLWLNRYEIFSLSNQRSTKSPLSSRFWDGSCYWPPIELNRLIYIYKNRYR